MYIQVLFLYQDVFYIVERFSIDCHKTKTKVITLAHRKGQG